MKNCKIEIQILGFQKSSKTVYRNLEGGSRIRGIFGFTREVAACENSTYFFIELPLSQICYTGKGVQSPFYGLCSSSYYYSSRHALTCAIPQQSPSKNGHRTPVADTKSMSDIQKLKSTRSEIIARIIIIRMLFKFPNLRTLE